MNRVFAWIKQRPVLTGAIVIVAGLAAYLILSRGGGGAVQYVDGGSTGPTDAQVAAQTQLAMAGLSAGVQAQSIQAQLAALQYQGQTDIALADRSLDAALAQIAAAAGVQTQQTAASRDVALAQIQAGVTQSAQQADIYKLFALSTMKKSQLKTLGKYGVLGTPETPANSVNILGQTVMIPAVTSSTSGNSVQALI